MSVLSSDNPKMLSKSRDGAFAGFSIGIQRTEDKEVTG